jgi:hypothetical protein
MAGGLIQVLSARAPFRLFGIALTIVLTKICNVVADVYDGGCLVV